MAAASGANAAMTTVTYGSTRVSRPTALLLASTSAGSAAVPAVDGPALRALFPPAACPAAPLRDCAAVSLRDWPAPLRDCAASARDCPATSARDCPAATARDCPAVPVRDWPPPLPAATCPAA